MHLKAGQTLAKKRLRDGIEVTLRTPRMEDLDDLLAYINALVKENVMTIMTKPPKRDEEARWLGGILADIETGKSVYIVAEIGGKVVANGNISFMTGKKAHVCTLGIAISKSYRDRGLGTILMNELIKQARKFGKKLILLDVFELNPRAKHVYEKVGFREVGRMPGMLFHKGKYQAGIMMAKEI
jgi:RimJ/RimL family protein N-acetyltransferase